jgi:hypothetical protein
MESPFQFFDRDTGARKGHPTRGLNQPYTGFRILVLDFALGDRLIS